MGKFIWETSHIVVYHTHTHTHIYINWTLGLKNYPLDFDVSKPWIQVLKNQIDVGRSLIDPRYFTW